ncbi:hypothetical protein DSM14862_03530 (plasmid) [Sulfitobacter indolifex]|uniref:lipopolysaccharide biosynthesis protein n=1 Tax=Sulfitobacter indolifex TaxID=225422 RepID=UPI001FADCE27|nr:oligosaccharide flippase family protein [Sulfitobacter indolifex]UOA20692.1 hypothetical protein DSM14862_03530 [Sulfitobacter indolifex]
MQRFVRDSLALFSGQAVRVVIGLGSTIALARFLGADARGQFAIVMASTSILSTVLTFGMPQTNWIFSGLDSKKNDQLLGITLLTCILASLLGFILIFNASVFLPSIYSFDVFRDPIFLISAGTLCALMILYSCLIEFLKGNQQFPFLGSILPFQAFLIFLGYVICYNFELGIYSAVLIQNGATFIAVILLFARACKVAAPSLAFSKEYMAKIARSCFSYFSVSLAITLAQHSTPIFMSFFAMEASEIAQLAIALALIGQLELIPTAVTSAFLPSLARGSDLTEAQIASKVAWTCKLSAIIFFIIFISIAIPFVLLILPIFLGPEYELVGPLFIILSLGSFAASTGKIINVFFNLTNRASLEAIPVWVRVVLQIGLISLAGLAGNIYLFAVSIVVGRIARILLSYFFFYRHTGITPVQLAPNFEAVRRVLQIPNDLLAKRSGK